MDQDDATGRTVGEPLRAGAARPGSRTAARQRKWPRFSVRIRWIGDDWSVSRLYPDIEARSHQDAVAYARLLADGEAKLEFFRNAGRESVTVWRLKGRAAQ